MALAESQYPDVPIDSKKQIRVLEIDPAFRDGQWSDTLQCTLKARRLGQIELDREIPWRYGHPADDPRWFEALSYTWGTWEDPRSALVNGQPFRVTQNLYLALRRLRRFDAIRRVWIDQICINQDSNEERSNQVARMGEIFSLASQVLIWLGESALPLPDRTSRKTPRYYSFLAQLSRAVQSTTPVWWSRAWVVQEKLLTRDLQYSRVLFGPMDIKWSQMMRLLGTDIMDPDEPTELHAIAQHFDSLPRRDGNFVTFGPLMHHMQCSDARDKVFGLLGLLTDFHRARNPVDYNSDASEVFTRATYTDIEATRNLDILCLVSKPSHLGVRDLPSWCVGFTFPRNDRSLRFDPEGVHDFARWVGCDVPRWHRSQPRVQHRSVFSPEDTSLSFCGLRLDKVRATLPVAQRPKVYNYAFAEDECERVRESLAAVTREKDFHLRWCTSQSANDILKSLGTLPLSAGQVGYDCAALLVRDGNPELERRPRNRNLELDRYSRYVEASNDGAALFLTQYGHLGFGADTISPGDVIVLLYASRFALALRELSNSPGHWTFLSLVRVPSIADLKLNDPGTDDGQLVAEDFRVI